MYLEFTGFQATITKTDILIVHAFKERLPSELETTVREFLKENPVIVTFVKQKRDRKLLFRSPTIFLIYYMVKCHPEKTKDLWPLVLDDLEPVYTDLGKPL